MAFQVESKLPELNKINEQNNKIKRFAKIALKNKLY